MLKMFRGYQLAVNVLKEKGAIFAGSVVGVAHQWISLDVIKGSASTRKGGSGKNQKVHQSMLSVKGLATMLSTLLRYPSPSHWMSLQLSSTLLVMSCQLTSQALRC